MTEKRIGPKRWLNFEFPAGCALDDKLKEIWKEKAAGIKGGGCCPYYFCYIEKDGSQCDAKTAGKCAEKCESFYEEYIREKEN